MVSIYRPSTVGGGVIQIVHLWTMCDVSPSPRMHPVHGRMHDPHVVLWQVPGSKKSWVSTESQLTLKTGAVGSRYTVTQRHDNFLDSITGAAQTSWKYIGPPMEVAEQARISDPALLAEHPWG